MTTSQSSGGTATVPPTSQRLLDAVTHYAVIALDPEGHVTRWNQGARNLFHYPAAEIIGHSATLLDSAPSRRADAALRESLETAHRTGHCERHAWWRRQDGSTFWAHVIITAMHGEGGELTGYAAVVRNAGEEQQTRATLTALIESAAYALIATTERGCITVFNPAAERLLGYRAEELIGRETPARFHLVEEVVARAAQLTDELGVRVEPGFQAFVAKTNQTGAPDERQWTYVHRSGRSIPVLLSVTALRAPDGRIGGYLGIARDVSELAAAQDQLRQQSDLKQLVFAANVDPMFIIDEHGTVLESNPSTERVLGWKVADLIGRNIRALVPPEIAPYHDGYLRRYLQTREAKIIGRDREVEAMRADGERIHANLSISEGHFGNRTVFVGTLRDISARRAAEERQQRAQRETARTKAQLDEAISALDAGLAMFDERRCLIACNQRYAEMFDVPQALTRPGTPLQNMIEAARAQAPQAMGSGASREAPERPDSSRTRAVVQVGGRWVRCDFRHTPSGGFVSLHTDITALKEAEAEALHQERRLLLATITAELGIWEVDMATLEMTWDARMCAIVGRTRSDFGGSLDEWVQTLHPEDREATERLLLQCLKGGQEFRHRYRVVREGGDVRYVDSRSDYVRDEAGRPRRLLATSQDVTEQVESENRLREAVVAAEDAAKAKAEFLATMSHEIRTPMNGVIGMASLLVGTALDPQQREFAETIRASGESLLTLINDVLDFSKMEAGRLELERIPFSLDDAVTQALNLFTDAADKKGVRLAHCLPPERTYLVGDPTRFRQILLNLLSNAMKFTKRGHVEVRLSCRTDSDELCHVTLEVEDTGVGMSTEQIERLGEAFVQADASTTRQFGGTGLGISICKSLTRLMGGEIHARSELGVGTTFQVELPFASAVESDLKPREEAPVPSRAKLSRVLVVEDNSVNQRVVTAMLAPFARHVDVAENGRIGYEHFVQSHYDLVLMDGQMPELDGIEATRLIRSFEREHGRTHTPVVALTANALPGDREEFLAAGMDDYISKPLRREDLAHLLARLALSPPGSLG